MIEVRRKITFLDRTLTKFLTIFDLIVYHSKFDYARYFFVFQHDGKKIRYDFDGGYNNFIKKLIEDGWAEVENITINKFVHSEDDLKMFLE